VSYQSDSERADALSSQVVTPPTDQPPITPERAATVLLVDDNDGVRVLSARVLEESGYEVLEAPSGRAALELLHSRGRPPDLIITDVRMPQMSGGELAAELKLLFPSTPVLFISGFTDEPFGRRAQVPSSIRVLQKPFTPEALLARVAEFIGSGRRR
jgi:two-component system, cell cycle sensor histidine kinase and response regulator CckA